MVSVSYMLVISRHVTDKERLVLQIWLYAYNWTNDAFSTLSKHMTKLIQWNNCRTHLLSNVVTQKCGLFNHLLYGEVSFSMVSW